MAQWTGVTAELAKTTKLPADIMTHPPLVPLRVFPTLHFPTLSARCEQGLRGRWQLTVRPVEHSRTDAPRLPVLGTGDVPRPQLPARWSEGYR